MAEFIAQPDNKFRLGDFLVQSFANPDWTIFRAAVAFVKRSGTKHIRSALTAFSKRASAAISVGIDSGGTSAEGLEDLLAAVTPGGKLRVFHNAGSSTFHPKVYLFKNRIAANIVVGSGNLTEGGLYTNYEAGIHLRLDLSIATHKALLASIELALDRWALIVPGMCYELDASLLKKLVDSGEVPEEAWAKETDEGDSGSKTAGTKRVGSLFKAFRVSAAPKVSGHPGRGKSAKSAATAKSAASTLTTSGYKFLMALQKTDVGFGQTNAGAAQRSPEIFIPIRAVDSNPAFWGWPGAYVVDNAWSKKHAKKISKLKKTRRSNRPLKKMDRENVRIKIAGVGKPVHATIWYNPLKVDVRIRDKTLRAAGRVGDIMVLEKTGAGPKYDYLFTIVAPGDPRFPALKTACNVPAAANSKKTYAYI